MVIDPITPSFAADVGDVDLSRPLDDADWEQIQNAFWTYAVLVFPEQRLTTDEHLNFARRWGFRKHTVREFVYLNR